MQRERGAVAQGEGGAGGRSGVWGVGRNGGWTGGGNCLKLRWMVVESGAWRVGTEGGFGRQLWAM